MNPQPPFSSSSLTSNLLEVEHLMLLCAPTFTTSTPYTTTSNPTCPSGAAVRGVGRVGGGAPRSPRTPPHLAHNLNASRICPPPRNPPRVGEARLPLARAPPQPAPRGSVGGEEVGGAAAGGMGGLGGRAPGGGAAVARGAAALAQGRHARPPLCHRGVGCHAPRKGCAGCAGREHAGKEEGYARARGPSCVDAAPTAEERGSAPREVSGGAGRTGPPPGGDWGVESGCRAPGTHAQRHQVPPAPTP